MFRGNFLTLPVRAESFVIMNLEPVRSYVSFSGFRIARDNARKRNEAAGIFRPALQDGKLVERKIIFANYFLAWSGGNCFRKELPHLGQHGQHFDFVEKALRRFYVHELADAIGDHVEFVNFEREIHAAGGAELIDEDLGSGMAFDVLKE